MARLIQSSIKGIWVHGPAGSKMQGPKKSPLARWAQLGHIITPIFSSIAVFSRADCGALPIIVSSVFVRSFLFRGSAAVGPWDG
jgi:hypothetical protein